MFQTIDPITLNYLVTFLEFNKESMPKHVPQAPFWKSSICILIYTNQALHTKSITMGKEKAEAYNNRLILQVLFDSWGRWRNSK